MATSDFLVTYANSLIVLALCLSLFLSGSKLLVVWASLIVADILGTIGGLMAGQFIYAIACLLLACYSAYQFRKATLISDEDVSYTNGTSNSIKKDSREKVS